MLKYVDSKEDTLTATEDQFFEQISSYLPLDDELQVQAAFELAKREHGDQRRKSGEPFFTHPLTVAYYLTEYRLDGPAIAAALLHDVAEDTKVSLAELEEQFGPKVAHLVEGVTKLKDVSIGIAQGRELTREQIQDLTMQKLFREMTVDVRVVIIKLFDRLHNMRTIGAMPPHKQRQKARETLAVFAPLANRLGIWKLKSELEALSLQVLEPAAFQYISQELDTLKKNQLKMYQMVNEQITDSLLAVNLDIRNVLLAPENVYTVYQDLSKNRNTKGDIDRTLRLVVLLDDWISCYTALGHLHQLWRAVPDQFDDYISVPRDNLYRSLHTTVVHNNGQHIKIRLRTVAMDKVSEIGVLARWLYAGTPLWDKGIAERIEALFQNIRNSLDLEDEDAGINVKTVVEDVFSDQIRVYTPQGDAVSLPRGATAIDFAYKIHTEIGNHCQAVHVNDTLYPLNKALPNGAQVRVVKSIRAEPQRAWLDEDLGYITTMYARSHARRWFRRLPRPSAIKQGKQILRDELKMLGLPNFPHEAVSQMFEEIEDTEELYHALGRAEILPTTLATSVLSKAWTQNPSRDLDGTVQGRDGKEYVISQTRQRKIRLCNTCVPRPSDPIMGYLRQNGEVTVHREDCHSLSAHRDELRRIQLGWGEVPRRVHSLHLRVDVYDRSGLLFDVTQLLEREHINIANISTPTHTRKGEVCILLELEMQTARQAVRIMHQIQALVNIYSVRTIPSDTRPPADSNPSSFYQPE